MPTGKSRMTLKAHVVPIYAHVSVMPWREIEDAAGKSFSKEERAEIYRCTLAYSGELAWQKEGAAPKEIDALRGEILDHARGLHKIWNYRTQFDFGNGNEPRDVEGRLALQTLAASYGAEGERKLYKELRRADMFSKRLIRLLEVPPVAAIEPTRTSPQVAALVKFALAVLDGASARPARSKQPDAEERERWSIPVGPSSVVFCRFVNAVLQSNFSPNQVRDGFRSALAELKDRGK